MNLLKFDDIIIWSYEYVYSKKFSSNIILSTRRKLYVTKIFKIIFNFIKNSRYRGKVMILSNYMLIKKNFWENLDIIISKENYDVLQLAIDNSNDNPEFFNRIFSIGGFIIDLSRININYFCKTNISDIETDNIISSNIQLLMHPQRYNIYGKIGGTKHLSYELKNLIEMNFSKYLSNDEFYNYLVNGENPFVDISQINVSKSLTKFKNRIIEKYCFSDYRKKSLSTIFFGLYNMDDVDRLKNHKGKKYILWGGSDIDDSIPSHKKLISKIMKIRVDGHYAISKNINERLQKYKIKAKLIKFNLTDKKLFKPLRKFGDSIYIYNGNNRGREYIYGEEYYEKIVNMFKEINFIYSVNLNKNYEQMPDVYKKCFLGLRLTKNDGNANTVQEMGAMNIPVIHNGEEPNSIKWSSLTDIELKIRYKNIDLFVNNLDKFNKILFLCSDYPNYGGAATNCLSIINFLVGKGKDCRGLFFTDIGDGEIENLDFGANIKVLNIDKREEYVKKYVQENNIDLIIFRNFIRNLSLEKLKVFSIPIYFMIPGIFEPHLDKHYSKIVDKKEMNKYIHNEILKCIKLADYSYCGSYHTIKILKKYYNLKVKNLYFNYIPFYGKLIGPFNNFENRKYDYAVIVSNFKRKVKNIDEIIRCLRLISNKNKKLKIILIGKNSLDYHFENARCIELIKNCYVNRYYKEIKYIIQDSFYESCSNVYVEGRFNGCKIINCKELIELNNFNEGKLKEQEIELEKKNKELKRIEKEKK